MLRKGEEKGCVEGCGEGSMEKKVWGWEALRKEGTGYVKRMKRDIG